MIRPVAWMWVAVWVWAAEPLRLHVGRILDVGRCAPRWE
jgi:hypothetical protein